MSARISLSKCVVFTALAIVCAIGGAGAALAPPLAFEDRNNNGVFDGSDVDITKRLLSERYFETAQSVVITGGPMKIPDPHFRQTGLLGGAEIQAGKNITVLSSILAPFYAGTVVLWAGDSVRVGDKVTLQGRDQVDIHAGNQVVIGNDVKMLASGGSFNFGSATIYSHGNVAIGSKFQVTTLTDSLIYALGGEIVVGPGSKIVSSRRTASLFANTSITVDGVQLRGSSGVSLSSISGIGPISARNTSMSVSRGASILVIAERGTVDLSGSRFSVPPQVVASSVEW